MKITYALIAAFALWVNSNLCSAEASPKLVVVISVDQFAAHLYDQWRPKFTGGLKTLSTGIVYPSGYQAHAATETCPGHATLLTGVHPARNSIVANNWYDARTGKDMYCVQDDTAKLIGLPDLIPAKDKRRTAMSPKNMTATTLGDWSQAASPDNRMFAISGKDRGAITMAGQNPTSVYWYVDGAGFVTYAKENIADADRLKLVQNFNARLISDWKKKPPKWTYIDKTCAKLEAEVTTGDLTYTSKVPPALPQPTKDLPFDTSDGVKNFYRGTPLLDNITFKLAEKMIVEQKMGKGKGIDIFSISLSSTDYIGHRYGTQGPEMCDQLTRLDRGLGRLLKQLANLKVPVLVALSADHGSMDIVERTKAAGYPATHFNAGKLLEKMNQEIRNRLKSLTYNPLASADKNRDIEQIHIVTAQGLAETGKIRADIMALAKELLLTQKPDIVAVFSREEAIAALPDKSVPVDEYSLLQRFAVNADQKNAGDIFVAVKPYAFGGYPKKLGDTVASHGTPYNYDRRVPILFWWPGVASQERTLGIPTVDIAPSLANALGIRVPVPIDGQCRPLISPCPAP
jgi:predicted AlkP superfamily pyrophosphatase or phosphodiesterase